MEIIVVAIIGGLAGAFVHSFLSKRRLVANPAGSLNPPAPASPGVLRVTRLELVDENGNLRGSMFMGDDGPALTLAGPDERPRVILATRDGDRYSSDLQIFDAEGNMQVRLGVLPDRTGMALIKNGTVRMALNTDDDAGALSFFEPGEGSASQSRHLESTRG